MFWLSKFAIAAALDLSEYALLFFSLMLVVGIFGEYKKLPRPLLRSKKLFEMLVMIGVAGELLGDGGVFVFSRRMQILEGADMQALDRKAESALADATEAGSKAKAASDESDTAKIQSGNARAVAGEAGALARGARQEASVLNGNVLSIKAQAIGLSAKLAEAVRRADRADAATEQLRNDNLIAAGKLEDEQRKRLELVASLFLTRVFCDQSGAMAAVARFPPRKIVFEFVEQDEPKNMAEQIGFVFGAFLDWPISRIRRDGDVIPEGVYISPGTQDAPELSVLVTPAARSQYEEDFKLQKSTGRALAEALRDSLAKCDIDAFVWDARNSIPGDALLIRVGTKPNRALASAIKELGPPPSPTRFGRIKADANSMDIPDENPPNQKP